MSAYIVDPRTIDYLVAWAQRHHSDHSTLSARIPESLPLGALPKCLQGLAAPGERFALIQVMPNDLGAILMAENVRSVQARYPSDAPDSLPGPCAQRRVWAYRFQPIPTTLRPEWVIKAADCLDYQSCDTGNWPETVAYAIVQAIRENAIAELVKDAPWSVSDDDLQIVRV